MVEKQENNNSKKAEKKEQKKSQKDMNGVIGSVVFGLLFAIAAYQIYRFFIFFTIGKILTSIIGSFAFIFFMVGVSCFFDYKESKKLGLV